MRLKNRYFFWVVCLLVLGQVTMAQDDTGQTEETAFSLEDAYAYALKNNLNVKVKETDVMIAKEQENEIRAGGLPQVNASINYQYFIQIPTSLVPANALDPMAPDDVYQELQFGTRNNITAGIEASQLLFSGSYLTALDATKEFAKLKEEEIQQTKRDVKLSIAQSYYAALIAQEQIGLLENNKENLSKVLFETEQLYENGFVEALDVDRLNLSLSNLDLQIINAERNYNLALEAFKFQIGMPLKEAIVLTNSLEEVLPELEEIAIEDGAFDPKKRVEYRVLDRQRKLNDLDIQNYEWQRYPNVAAFASYQQGFQQNDLGQIFKGQFWFPTFVAGLQINIPIFTGLRTNAQIEQRRLQSLQITQAQQLLKQSFDLEIEQARTNYTNALEQVKSQKENYELAEKIYDVTLIKYKEGLGSSLEVNAAERELYQTQALYVQALYNLSVSKINLDKALGNL